MGEPNDPLCQWCDVPIPLGRGSLCRACQKAEDDAQDDYLDDCMSDEEIEAAERAYENSKARAEWDHYHPGEPCPDIELPHPKNSS